MQTKIEKFYKFLTEITKQEADFMESVVKWNDETKLAFLIAKRNFDDFDEEERKEINEMASNRDTNKRLKSSSKKSKANIKETKSALRGVDC